MKLYCIASGSSGNSILVEADGRTLLFDAGISAKRIEQGIEAGGFAWPEAIFITHEHSDHIQGLEVYLKHHPANVYATEGTLYGIVNSFKGSIPKNLFRFLLPEKPFMLGQVEVTAVSSSHDAADPCFYVVKAEGRKLCIATDLGTYKDSYVDWLKGADALYLESNYDENMLMAGPYPYSLKQRVAGNLGHLSNDMSAELAVKVLHPGLKHIILAHLSKENNYAELAHETMRQAVNSAWEYDSPAPSVSVANRDIPTAILEF